MYEYCIHSQVRKFVLNKIHLSYQLREEDKIINIFVLTFYFADKFKSGSQGVKLKLWRAMFAFRASRSLESQKIFSRAARSIDSVRHAENLCICSARFARIAIKIPSH